MARTWFGEVCSCCSLTVLLGPAWVLFKYVLQTIFSGPVLLHGRDFTILDSHIEIFLVSSLIQP